jgi:hypothetical protein
MLHAKKYFCNFGILASSANSMLSSANAAVKTLDMLIVPMLTKVQNTIKNAVKNQTKIQR